jgi:hypothetical protein
MLEPNTIRDPSMLNNTIDAYNQNLHVGGRRLNGAPQQALNTDGRESLPYKNGGGKRISEKNNSLSNMNSQT